MTSAGVKIGVRMNFSVTQRKIGIQRFVLWHLRALRVPRVTLLAATCLTAMRTCRDHGEQCRCNGAGERAGFEMERRLRPSGAWLVGQCDSG